MPGSKRNGSRAAVVLRRALPPLQWSRRRQRRSLPGRAAEVQLGLATSKSSTYRMRNVRLLLAVLMKPRGLTTRALAMARQSLAMRTASTFRRRTRERPQVTLCWYQSSALAWQRLMWPAAWRLPLRANVPKSVLQHDLALASERGQSAISLACVRRPRGRRKLPVRGTLSDVNSYLHDPH